MCVCVCVCVCVCMCAHMSYILDASVSKLIFFDKCSGFL